MSENSINKIDKNSIVIGCNYHTKWQKDKGMRFVLKEINGDKARLITRKTNRDFWTNVSDLIFIMTKYNIDKAKCKPKSLHYANHNI
jgi:hypothetical protein